ncbi:MAG: N-6 DNA methylase [Gammaproteobacteria bacterium]|nr:N-6 DNA methylase [Gammaproteobacteria bacterium]
MADRERRSLIFAHQEWLGFVQPVGLVVAPTVMVDAQVVPDRNISGRQRAFRALFDANVETTEVTGLAEGNATYRTPAAHGSFPDRVFRDWLGWEDGDLVDAGVHRETLEVSLPELQVVLAPTWAVPADEGGNAEWALLVRVEDGSADLDRAPDDGAGWNASRHARFERLLRETAVPTGLLCTDELVRLIHAPEGESSGHITFEFAQMALPAGRPILAAFDMLLSAEALFGGAPEARLPGLLAKSREAQAEVSTKLSRQVLAALHELLRGFVAADARSAGTVTELSRHDPDRLYGGLITTLMRLVFVLYAEDRGLMPDHAVYQQNYSLGGLFARLRSDAAAWPDTMDQRFGAWAQLLALFRLIHGGGGHGGLSFVARKGSLFDPDRFPFLEGRGVDADAAIPMVPDATVWNVLRSLMVLDGERLSYRTLDVEQIGSVYEAVMGFRVELTTGRSIAVASSKGTGAAVIVDIDTLLELEGSKRAKSVQDRTDRKLTGKAATALRGAATVEDIVAAFDRAVDRDATPDIVPGGTPVLQPTDERRRSGSHYTPRSLTEPIVSEALRPIFERLGSDARPEDILDLKVLDPTTGSGAFLVEACRQLSARLTEAWSVHGGPPELPADEDELLHARRLVAQRCLYGVDRNPMAIDLARLSLWLVTLARDHAFTFIDHALRHGDSLVGLTRKQIEGFHWDAEVPRFQFGTETPEVQKHVARVSEMRQLIRELGDDAPEHELRELLDEADRELRNVRRVGGLVLTAFFEGTKSKEREARRFSYTKLLLETGHVDGGNPPAPPVTAFHWGFEFPEVFDRENPGFDAVVGNPPFAGKNTVAAAHPAAYPDWLKQLHTQSHGNSDLVAHFFRRAFGLLRDGGSLGLIATNTIGQGDTRSTGLRWICHHGGEIYRVQRRLKWPGDAAVVVSVVHIAKGSYSGSRALDGRKTDRITAFLFHDGGHDDPERLKTNAGKSFQGSIVLGMGFTFDDTDGKGVATPISEMERLIAENPNNQDAIFPYIGGEEINASPLHAHHRYVINFRDWPLRRTDLGSTWRDADDDTRRDWRRDGIVPLDYSESVAADWPELLAVVEERVKPQRAALPPKNSINRDAAKNWWRFLAYRQGLHSAIHGMNVVIGLSRYGQQFSFTFLPAEMVHSDSVIVFPFDTPAAFCALQSRPHEIWARFFGSSLEDRLRYTPSDCFETFPLPENWESHPALESAGATYYDFRAALMIDNDEGMTKTYNRFHDPDERDPRIVELRRLHAAMDRAVLDVYGWDDIPTDCEFLLDYEIDEETWGRKKKPWRYRWPDDVRDVVLARLLALNAERARAERERGESPIHSLASPADG